MKNRMLKPGFSVTANTGILRNSGIGENGSFNLHNFVGILIPEHDILTSHMVKHRIHVRVEIVLWLLEAFNNDTWHKLSSMAERNNGAIMC